MVSYPFKSPVSHTIQLMRLCHIIMISGRTVTSHSQFVHLVLGIHKNIASNIILRKAIVFGLKNNHQIEVIKIKEFQNI
jgi:hypothetical protein